MAVQIGSAAQIIPNLWKGIQAFATTPLTPARKVAAAVAISGGLYIAGLTVQAQINLLNSTFLRLKLRNARNRKRKECKEALEKLEEQIKHSTVSSEERDAILSLSLPELVAKLHSGELKAVDVLEAYQWAALEAHKKTNCLIEPFVEAKALAEALDAQEDKKGPLHGVPISIKDSYLVQGYDSTMGVSGFIDKPAQEDAAIVSVLKDLGAVPFVKTNIPQTLMSMDGSNPIFGQTTHPQNSERSPGGSSSGEGALIACGGSPLGMGSDIGGSIRAPCHFCGIYGLKCTVGRLSPRGSVGCVRGQKLITGAFGPMARDVDSLVLAMRALLGPEMYAKDSIIPIMPFNTQMYEGSGKLRIGLYTENPILQTSEPCRRAVRHAGEMLQAMGHEIVIINTEQEQLEAWKFFSKTNFADRGRSYFEALRGDVWDASMKTPLTAVAMPKIIIKTLASLFRIRNWWSSAAIIMENFVGLKDPYEWWSHTQDVEDFRHKVADDWRGMKLDAVVAPFVYPAMYCGGPMNAVGVTSATTFYNLLNFPGGCIPVTTVTEDDEERSKDYPRTNPWEYVAKKSLCGMVGLPVGVQVVSYPWHEEMCLRVMKELEKGLKQ